MPSEAESHQEAVKVLYDLQMGLWEVGLSELSYDKERDCFRFKDGRFAFSQTKANWQLLYERDYRP